ncbi:MAG: choice-of-anchor tandem repeat GloVer-containing protein, partial [Capsulimonadaceae bacterium]
GNFYGTTYFGGSAGCGTVFRITPAGVVTILHSFNDGTVANDGEYPAANLLLGADGNFYGTTEYGGWSGSGTAYKVTTSGTVTILHNFSDGSVPDDGANPWAPLIQAFNGVLYGTTNAGGAGGNGTVFSMSTSGAETVLYSFAPITGTIDGTDPNAVLLGSDGNLYGTTSAGGSAGFGTVYQLTTAGSETILHNFSDGTVAYDGANPQGALIQANDGDFYGTASEGGVGGGAAFRMTSSGTFTILHAFGDGSLTNDGLNPGGGLVQGIDGAVYGTTASDLAFASGTVYRLNAGLTPTIPLPSTPTGLTATAGESQISLSWTASTGETSYNIYRGTATGAESSTPVGAATGTAYTDTGLTSSVAYFYTVAAVNGGGTSAQSTEASATPEPPVPAAPTGLSATAGNAQVALSWTASTGATSYSIYRGTASGAEGSTAVGTATSTTDTDTGLTNGVTYYYKVAAINGGGTSSQSSEAFATPVPSAPTAPTGLTATAGSTKVSLSWTASTGATSYNIYRGTASGAEGSTSVGTATSTTDTDTGLTNGVTYYYKVAAINGGGTSAQSSEAYATPEPSIPAAPTGLTETAGNTQVGLSWTASTGATAYNVYRGTVSGGEGSTQVGTFTNTAYIDAGLTNGVKYFYKVAAINGGGTSAQSTEVSATPEPPAPAAPTGLTATPGNTVVSLSWAASTGATSYNVYRSTTSGGEGSTAVGAASATTYSDAGLTNGVNYYYKVAAVNGGGTSAQSSEVSATPEPPVPAAPTALTATAGNAQVSLTWPGSSGATSYSIYRATTSGAEGTTAIGTATTTSFVNTGLTNGVKYYYTVAAVDSGGTSAQSIESSATPEPQVPAAPTGLAATAASGQVSLSWSAGTGATSYNVYRGTASGAEGTTAIGTTTSTSYTDTGLTNGIAYYYKVAGVNGGGTSSMSNEASATPGPPASSITHVLWSGSGALSLWAYNPGTGAYTAYDYTPSSTWSARAIADGPDGNTRVLWVNTASGAASIWIVNDTNGTFTQNTFGPFPGWSATALSVGSNNVTHVLWTSNTGGNASVWNYTGTPTYTQNTFGPYAGWSATAIADGPDGMTRLMWVSSAGAASLWNMNSTTGAFTSYTFGPFGGWTAAGLSVGAKNMTHVLWANVSGASSLWNYTASAGTYTQVGFSPFPGWTPVSVADASDGTTRLLWDCTTGAASIWDVNSTTGAYSQNTFGPYGGWTATEVTAYP